MAINLLNKLSRPTRELVLRHASFGWPNNQRLEWLGDSVLDLIFADVLYQDFPEAREGWLTRQRQNRVNQTMLAAWARQMNWQRWVVWHEQPIKPEAAMARALADMLEACAGGLFLEHGYLQAKTWLIASWEEVWPIIKLQMTTTCQDKDAKTALQEWTQSRGYGLPLYRVKQQSAPGDEPFFGIELTIIAINGTWQGEGRNKREAEQQAAMLAWQEISNHE